MVFSEATRIRVFFTVITRTRANIIQTFPRVGHHFNGFSLEQFVITLFMVIYYVYFTINEHVLAIIRGNFHGNSDIATEDDPSMIYFQLIQIDQ